MNGAIQDGEAIFPLSAVHYMETIKHRNMERRARLGAVMWQLSGGHTPERA